MFKSSNPSIRDIWWQLYLGDLSKWHLLVLATLQCHNLKTSERILIIAASFSWEINAMYYSFEVFMSHKWFLNTTMHFSRKCKGLRVCVWLCWTELGFECRFMNAVLGLFFSFLFSVFLHRRGSVCNRFLRHLGSHIPSLGLQVHAGYFCFHNPLQDL